MRLDADCGYLSLDRADAAVKRNSCARAHNDDRMTISSAFLLVPSLFHVAQRRRDNDVGTEERSSTFVEDGRDYRELYACYGCKCACRSRLSHCEITDSFLQTSSNSAVAISLPTMEQDLQIPQAALQWVVSANPLSSVCVL